MRLFSEATLLKMETSCTRHRKDWEASPSFILTWLYPTLLLKPDEAYTRKSYLYTSIVHTVALTLVVCAIPCLVVAGYALIAPDFWAQVSDPKNHAQQIGFLSQEGFYYLPFVPLIFLLFNLAINWPQYFFWNRRAKRLQQEEPALVPIIAAAVPDDITVWPPAPHR